MEIICGVVCKYLEVLTIYLFIYLLLLGRRQLPMHPGGDQHPKEITHVTYSTAVEGSVNAIHCMNF